MEIVSPMGHRSILQTLGMQALRVTTRTFSRGSAVKVCFCTKNEPWVGDVQGVQRIKNPWSGAGKAFTKTIDPVSAGT